MKETLINRLANLLTVKSLVTIILTVVFAVLTCLGKLDQNFMMIYTVVMSFYFGTQIRKETAATPENSIRVSWPEGMDPAEAVRLADDALHSGEDGEDK